MLIQIVIRLVVYIDQYITRTSSSKEGAAVTTISSPQCAKAAGGGNSSFIGDYDSSSGDTSIFRGIDNTVWYLLLFLITKKLFRQKLLIETTKYMFYLFPAILVWVSLCFAGICKNSDVSLVFHRGSPLTQRVNNKRISVHWRPKVKLILLCDYPL